VAEIRLPPPQMADVDRATVERLFDDVSLLGDGVSVSIKGGLLSRASAAGSLAEARALLFSGNTSAVQLRYGHEGASWCDTVIASGVGFRLVRVKSEDVLASSLEGETQE
jgi:hypothetical protein